MLQKTEHSFRDGSRASVEIELNKISKRELEELHNGFQIDYVSRTHNVSTTRRRLEFG